MCVKCYMCSNIMLINRSFETTAIAAKSLKALKPLSMFHIIFFSRCSSYMIFKIIIKTMGNISRACLIKCITHSIVEFCYLKLTQEKYFCSQTIAYLLFLTSYSYLN